MRPTKIYHTYPKVAGLFTTIALLPLTYDMHRVAHGTHPFISPRLEAFTLLRKQQALEKAQEGKQNSTNIWEEWDKGEVGWANLNGIPIPTLGMLIRPFRRA